jgi:amino acid transporter
MGFSLLLVWAIPEALITAELSTAMPEASGSVAWVEKAFGPFWAFQKGWLGWMSGVSDNALYPILFLDCFLQLITNTSGEGLLSDDSADGSIQNTRWIFIILITLALTFLNYRGLDIVGNVAIVVCLVSLMPFAVFCILGVSHVDPTRWLQAPEGGLAGVDWRLLLNTFFWNINFWESAASFSGDVEDPGKNYPTGMFIAVLMVFVTSFVPILIGTGASTVPYTEWRDGYFVRLASEVVGPWLGYWMMFAAAVTNIGMFEAEMSSDAWQVAGMADRGILPKCLGKRNAYGAPTYGVLLSATGVVCLGWLSFSEVVDMLNLLFCYGQVIEFCAFLHLRRTQPEMPRPYTVPVGLIGMCLMLSFPLLFIAIIVSFSSPTALLVSGTLTLLGVCAYYVLEFAKVNDLCRFHNKLALLSETSPMKIPTGSLLEDTQGP